MELLSTYYYVYILLSEKDNKHYIGYTHNLSLRFEQHTKGLVPSTKNRRPLKLIYFEACLNQQDATKREKYLPLGINLRFNAKQKVKEYKVIPIEIIHSRNKRSEVWNSQFSIQKIQVLSQDSYFGFSKFVKGTCPLVPTQNPCCRKIVSCDRFDLSPCTNSKKLCVTIPIRASLYCSH